MKDVRFADLVEPVGDVVRFAASCADDKKQKLVKQVALGQVRVVCLCSAVAPGPDKLWSSAVRFKQ